MGSALSEEGRAQAMAMAKGMIGNLGGGAAGPASDTAPNYGDDHGEDPKPAIGFDDLEAASRAEQVSDRDLRKLFFREARKQGLDDDRAPKRRERDDEEEDEDEQPSDSDPGDEADEEEDEDFDDEDGGDEEDDDPRMAKAKRVAQAHGLPKSAIKAMSRAELLAWSHKASRREARRTRGLQNQGNHQQRDADAQAGEQAGKNGAKAAVANPVLKERARALAERLGLGEDDASALEEFGQAIAAAKQPNTPDLATARAVQEAQIRREAELVRRSLGERFPELSDDEVFGEVMLEAVELISSGRVRDFERAIKKAAVIVLEDDDDRFERRVRSEVKSRHQRQRRKGGPQLPRRDRGDESRFELSKEESQERALRESFVHLAKGRKGAAKKAWNRHVQSRVRR